MTEEQKEKIRALLQSNSIWFTDWRWNSDGDEKSFDALSVDYIVDEIEKIMTDKS